jgi:hypothetical protein
VVHTLLVLPSLLLLLPLLLLLLLPGHRLG